MKAASPRIRTKFIGILIMASVLPVTAALFVFETLGYRSFRETRGRLHQARAQQVAVTLSDLVRQQLESLDDWVALSQLASSISRATESTPAQSPEEMKSVIDAIEARWPGAKTPVTDVERVVLGSRASGSAAASA